MQRKPKAHKLPDSMQEKVGRDYIESKRAGKPATYASIAKKHNCTPDQVRAYAERYEAGDYAGRRRRSRKRTESADIDQDANALELLSKQVTAAIMDLEAEDITVVERISLLDRLVAIKKSLQQISLVGHLKRADAELIVRIIRRFLPEASDEQAITIYREERARWEASL